MITNRSRSHRAVVGRHPSLTRDTGGQGGGRVLDGAEDAQSVQLVQWGVVRERPWCVWSSLGAINFGAACIGAYEQGVARSII